MFRRRPSTWALLLAIAVAPAGLTAQDRGDQPIDEEYTRLIL